MKKLESLMHEGLVTRCPNHETRLVSSGQSTPYADGKIMQPVYCTIQGCNYFKYLILTEEEIRKLKD